jgi:HSP20 family protein
MPEIKRREQKKDDFQRLLDTVETLHRRIDELVDAASEVSPTMRALWDGTTCCLEALGDVHETATEFTITVDLPMVNEEDIEITATPNVLSIHANTRSEIRFKRWGTVQREVSFKSFTKTVPLPPGTDADKIHASFHKGLLQIHVPKAPEGKQVSIK